MALAPFIETPARVRGTTAGASLMSLVTILDLQRYRHITNNGIDISPITVSTYDKQQKCDITNNGAGICALPHKTASAYDCMRLTAYNGIGICLYACMRLAA